jgi:UDP-glucose 4-epimerase
LIGVDRRLPLALRRVVSNLPLLKPVMPDTGVPFQLVHHDDVAAALCAAVVGKGAPGIYNLAAPGEITIGDLAHDLGWHTIPVPRFALDATAEAIARVPLLPKQASWIEALRWPVLMDTALARRQLTWRPRHNARETLRQTVAAWRERRAVSGTSPRGL